LSRTCTSSICTSNAHSRMTAACARLPKSSDLGLSFCRRTGLPSFMFITQPATRKEAIFRKMVRYCCSRSFKVIEINPNRKPVCDFLLVT